MHWQICAFTVVGSVPLNTKLCIYVLYSLNEHPASNYDVVKQIELVNQVLDALLCIKGFFKAIIM